MADEEHRIKSALEIALEKSRRLGSLSEEEKSRLRDEELAGAGESLAQRYLNGAPLREIEAGLAKREEGDRPTVRRYLLLRLLDEIGIGQSAQYEKIFSAIDHISGDTVLTEEIRGVLRLYEIELERAQQNTLHKLEKAKLDELAQRGISGSAISLSTENTQEWAGLRRNMESGYGKRLEEIRGKLRNEEI